MRSTAPPIPHAGPAGRRRWIFRMLAIAAGLMPFVATEIVCRVAGWGVADDFRDPFIDFAGQRPLFELNATGDRYVIPSSRKPFFKPDSFAAHKDPREFRIFCLGGSTVQGNPYSIETSFTTWLELSLNAADSRYRWEVVNCGGISYASYRLAPILDECLRHQPDLIVVYTGHNEFLEDRSYGHLKRWPEWSTEVVRWLELSRVLRLALAWGQRWRDNSTPQRRSPQQLGVEVEALLDYRGGLEQYHRDDRWRRDVAAHFRFTLGRMASQSGKAGIPLFLVDPVCNLKDCPPFKVEESEHLSVAARARLRELLQPPGTAQEASLPSDPVERLQAALAIDGRHAGAWYLLAQAELARGEDAAAYEASVRAKDEDICPLRATEPLRQVIVSVAESYEVPLIPVRHLMEQHSPHGIPGEELLLDHVHPSITGHQMIAGLILEMLAKQGRMRPEPGWHERQQRRYQAHLATLDTAYYARGKEHLDGLRKWAQGRVLKLRPPPHGAAAGQPR